MIKLPTGEAQRLTIPPEWFNHPLLIELINNHGQWLHSQQTKALVKFLESQKLGLEASLEGSVLDKNLGSDAVRAVAAQLVSITKTLGVINNAIELVKKAGLSP